MSDTLQLVVTLVKFNVEGSERSRQAKEALELRTTMYVRLEDKKPKGRCATSASQGWRRHSASKSLSSPQ
jgi:hypothetical protein